MTIMVGTPKIGDAHIQTSNMVTSATVADAVARKGHSEATVEDVPADEAKTSEPSRAQQKQKALVKIHSVPNGLSRVEGVRLRICTGCSVPKGY